MSELKGQLLGMILVLAAFGAILGVLIPGFESSANDINKAVDISNIIKTNTVKPASVTL